MHFVASVFHPGCHGRRTFLRQGLGISVGAISILGLGQAASPHAMTVTQRTAQLTLLAAAADGYVPGIEWAIQNGANINLVTPVRIHGVSCALLEAVKGNRISSIHYLLDHGSDPNIRICDITPLMAVRSIEAAALLVRFGADPNAANAGWSVLGHAMWNSDVFNFLLKNGGDINRKNNGGDRNLVAFASHYNSDVLTLVLDCGGSIYDADAAGNSAAFLLAQKIVNEPLGPGFSDDQQNFLTIFNHPSCDENRIRVEFGSKNLNLPSVMKLAKRRMIIDRHLEDVL